MKLFCGLERNWKSISYFSFHFLLIKPQLTWQSYGQKWRTQTHDLYMSCKRLSIVTWTIREPASSFLFNHITSQGYINNISSDLLLKELWRCTISILWFTIPISTIKVPLVSKLLPLAFFYNRLKKRKILGFRAKISKFTSVSPQLSIG